MVVGGRVVGQVEGSVMVGDRLLPALQKSSKSMSLVN